MKSKHLKSTADDLHAIVERSMVARDLAEPLASFDADQSIDKVRSFMEEKQYDVVGVRKDGLVVGYVRMSELMADNESIDKKLEGFHRELIPETCGIKGVLETLCDLDPSPAFVVGRVEHVWGIITRGDLQKAPVRMYLFGLITLLEMQLARLIRHYYPFDEWRHLLNGRVETAEQLFEDRRKRNEHIDLIDCLQFADKKQIVFKSDLLRSRIGFRSKSAVKSTLDELEGLRNTLAHGQDILAGRWPELVTVAASAEALLKSCEAPSAVE